MADSLDRQARLDKIVQLIAEKEQLERLIGEGETQSKEFHMLHEWSKGIVKAVRWLHSNLEQYLVEVLGCAPNPLAPAKPEALSKEDVAKHQKGLEEITRNLEESQDYFKATLDGRLHAFHEVEKAGIEAQLADMGGAWSASMRPKHVVGR